MMKIRKSPVSTWCLIPFVLPLLMSCGKQVISGRDVNGQPTILDDDANVMDATTFGVASKSELDAIVVNSMALADASLGRMFDFDGADAALVPAGKAASGKPVFCEGEVVTRDQASVTGADLKLVYEADVTSCANKPQSLAINSQTSPVFEARAADQLIVDRQLAAFSLTFACGSRDLAELARSSDGKASAVMATGSAFSCPAKGKAVTGRAYRFAGRIDGRFVGPRSEVPIQQRFWRGYDSGTPGAPCLLTREGSARGQLGACNLFERSESINLVDNSRKGRLMTVAASARTRNGSLFNDGDLAVKINGWAASHGFSSQDTDITLDFMRPSGDCARYSLRPSAVHFEARDCR